MINLWLKLPNKSPYVLEIDKELINSFNSTENNPDKKINLNFEPEPFTGNLNAPIVLLAFNPGLKDTGVPNDVDQFNHFRSENTLIKNIKQESVKYPFYYLDPKFKDYPGFKWWFGKLKILINEFGLEFMSNNILSIEYFPYHSKKAGNFPKIKSQEFSFELVKKAIKEKKFILIMRSEQLWLNAVPELRNYNYHKLNSSQNVAVTPNNLNGFDKLRETLETH